MPAFDRIGNSVGDSNKGAANRDREVRTIRGLLNIQIIGRHSSDTLLPVSGLHADRVDREMLSSIIDFQRRQGLPQSGLIEPGDKTDQALRHFRGPSNMGASSRAIHLIQGKERCKLQLYDDGYGRITIGWGHFVHRGQLGSDPSAERPFVNGITEIQAEQLLREDLRRSAERTVNDRVHVPLTQNQFDALVSICYNLGQGKFEHSKLLKMLNTGDYLGARREFADIVFANHQRSAGLVSRRQGEERLFEQR